MQASSQRVCRGAVPRPLMLGVGWGRCRGGRSPGVWGKGSPQPGLGGAYLATSLKVFFLVMPVPLAELPFQGSGCRGMGREEREVGGPGSCSVRAGGVGGSQPGVGGHLIVEGRRQDVVDHLLVEDGREAARDGGHDPGPVGGAAPPGLLFVLQVLHEGHSGGVVVHDGHLGELG